VLSDIGRVFHGWRGAAILRCGPVGDSRPTSRMQPWRAGSPDALSRAFWPPAVTRGYLSTDH
jgi:hypothetical protein